MYVWRGKGRRDRRENKLSGLFGWRAHKSVTNERIQDDILRQEQEGIHVGYFHYNVRVVMHEYLNTPDGKLEVQRIIEHLDDMALKKAIEDAEIAAIEAGDKNFDKSKVVAIPQEVKKRSNVYEVFRKFDADGGGTLDKEELGALLNDLKVKMTEEELDELFEELDEDGEGGIDFEEFYLWFTTEADKQQKKNLAGYVVNAVSQGMFDGFRRLVMEVEARNLSLDHAVWVAERDARAEYRIAHPPNFKCEKHTCGMSFATFQDYKAHKDDLESHDELDREHDELTKRFHAMELFLAGPLGRISSANRLLFSSDLANQQVRIKAAEPTPFRPATLDPEHKRQKQQLAGMMVQGYDPKMGLRPAPRKRALKTQHLAPGRTKEQAVLQDVISSLSHIRDDHIDIVSSPSTSAHADVVFTWKGFAADKIEVLGNFTGWKGEALSPYLQIPAPPDPLQTVEDDIKTVDSGSTASGSFNDVSTSSQVKKSLTFGRSSIIKQLGPGKYLYKYRVDGEEKLDEHASKAIDPVTGKECNILLVINPVMHHNQGVHSKKKKESRGEDESSDGSSYVSAASRLHDSKYGHLVHLNSLHTDEYKRSRNEEIAGMTKVNLRNMSLFDDGAWAFAAFMQRNSLIRYLDVSFNNISDDGMQAIGTVLPILLQLETFKANGNGFGIDGVRYIVPALAASTVITHVELSGNNIGDDGAEYIAQNLIPRHKYLRSLYIDDNKIGNDGAEQIGEGLLHNKYLETLSISKNLIYTYGAMRICFAVQSNGTLKYFRINDNPLGAPGARHLGEMLLMNDSLTYVDASNIDLQRNKDGSGLTMITSAIEKNKVLQYLSLRNGKITDLQAIDLIQALKNNLTIAHIDLRGNPISAHFFTLDTFFETKLGPRTPSIATRMAEIQELKANPAAKKFIGKPREVDAEDDGKWTWRRKWKKIDRRAEARRAKALLGAQEEEHIALENEYCSEQLEKYMVGVKAFLENPDCTIFLTTLSKTINQHFQELQRLLPQPQSPEEIKAEQSQKKSKTKLKGAVKALKAAKSMGENKNLFLPPPAPEGAPGQGLVSTSGAEETKALESDNASVVSGTSLVSAATALFSAASKTSNKSNGSAPASLSGVKGAMTLRQRNEYEEKERLRVEAEEKKKKKIGRDGDGSIPWDDQHFNHVHLSVCKAIFLTAGADPKSLFLPYTAMERALTMMTLPCSQEELQKAVYSCQVPNQPSISYKKFIEYVKTHAKALARSVGMKKWRIKTDLYFNPPIDEAKSIIIDHFRYKAFIDIRKNFRAQLEHKPPFLCPDCQERFSNQKHFDRHMAKGARNTSHRQQAMEKSIHDAQTYVLRRVKFEVTGTYFPAFFELAPEKNLLEDYIPQVFDAMGEEGRPIGTVEPNEVQLVEDVLGDFLQISYEGRMGWVKYRLPQEKARFQSVLHKACSDVPHFSWDSLVVHSKPIYYQVRNDDILPSMFELKVRLRPTLDAEVHGALKKGQIIESRAHMGEWLQIKFEDRDAAWVVMKVGGGRWKPPLSRAELKKKRQEEEEARKEKERIRAERIKAIKAQQLKKRGNRPPKPIVLKEDTEVLAIPPGEVGADTVTVLHECVQRRMEHVMAYSPYTPSKEDLIVPENWKYIEAERLAAIEEASQEEDLG